jgi:hypothetical protein
MASMVEIGKIESTTHTGSAKSFWILDFGLKESVSPVSSSLDGFAFLV